MIDFFNSTKEAFPALLAIFVTVFCLILVTRLIFAILIHFARKKYEALKKIKINPFAKKDVKKFEKEEEEKLRKLEIPRAHSETRASKIGKNNNYELVTSEEQELDNEEMNKIEIVDIVKPIGFWTSVILGQKLTYLIQSAQIINKRGKKGFWVSMIEAQDQSAGRQHGRSR